MSGELAAVTRELTALDDAGLGRALDAVAGEIHASAVQLAALDGEAATDLVRREIVSRGAPEDTAAAPGGGPFGGRSWMQVQSEHTAFAGGDAHGGDAQISGLTVGEDWTRTSWLVGIGGGYTKGRLALNGLAESSDYSATRGFGYVGYSAHRWTAHVGASIAPSRDEIRRTFAFTARLPETLGGAPLFGGVEHDAKSTSAGLATDVWGDWALPLRAGAWTIRPAGGVRYARYGRRGWQESGAATLSLSATDQTLRSAQGDLSLHVARALGRFQLNTSSAYRRELTDGRTAVTTQLSDRNDATFLVRGLPLTRDAVTTQAGVMFQADRVALSLSYDARLAPGQMRQGIQVSLGF
jgi:hypothetical protein